MRLGIEPPGSLPRLTSRVDSFKNLLLQVKCRSHHRTEAITAIAHRQKRQRVAWTGRRPAIGNRLSRLARLEGALELIRNNENLAWHLQEKQLAKQTIDGNLFVRF